MKTFLWGCFLYLVAQTIAWFQTNGSLIYKTIEDNIFLTSLICGPIVGTLFAYGTRYIFEETGQLWPARFLGFAIGYMVFIPLTWHFFGETPFTLKNILSFILCCVLICIQVFLK